MAPLHLATSPQLSCKWKHSGRLLRNWLDCSIRIGQEIPTLVVIRHKTHGWSDVVIIVWRCSLLLFGMLMALGAGGAAGKECLGVNFPEQTQADGSTLTLNGLGVRKATLLKINVYVAALYVANPSGDPNAILGSKAPIK